MINVKKVYVDEQSLFFKFYSFCSKVAFADNVP